MRKTFVNIFKWLSIGEVKSIVGCYVGCIIFVVIGFYLAVVVGLIIGSSLGERIIEIFIKEHPSNLTGHMVLLISSGIGGIGGMFFTLLISAIIGTTIGNFLGMNAINFVNWVKQPK